MTKRLIKVAKELNQGTTIIVEFLRAEGYEIVNRPTAKISAEMYERLCIYFGKRWVEKIKSKKKEDAIPSLKVTTRKKIETPNISKQKGGNNMMQVWKAFIEAQDIITSQYSHPFTISYSHSTDEGYHYFEYADNPSKNVEEKIKETFKSILEENIQLREGFFLYQSALLHLLDDNLLKALKEYCDANYFDFIPKPCITGTVCLISNPFRTLSEKLSLDIGYNGECFATLAQIEIIDKELNDLTELKRSSKIGAISKISASESLIKLQFNQISKYLKEEVGFEEFESFGITKTLVIKNAFLKEKHLHWITENSLYINAYHRIIISPHEDVFEYFQKERKKRRIFFQDEDNPSLSGIVLPNPINNEFHFKCSKDISLTDLKFEIFFRKKSFETYFGEDGFTIRHEHILKIDNQKFLKYIKNIIPFDIFQISEKSEMISFDFSNEQELHEYLEELKKVDEIFYRGFNNEHRYKIKFEYNSPLLSIASTLQEIPSIQAQLITGGTKLSFRYFFDEVDEIPQIRTRLINILNRIDSKIYSYNLENIDDGFVKYSIFFRNEEYQEEVERQLQYLKGEELLQYETDIPIGVLTKTKFPEIVLNSDTPLQLSKNEQVQVYGSLKGEKDKIRRLSDTVKAIFSKKSSITNPKLKQLLIDATNAETIDGDLLQSENYDDTLQFVIQELLTPKNRINQRQIEAITKSILSKDLFIIQGPPGTGKSTAIAEIIWQHIRNHFRISKEKESNYKILVTSETNLAVDNALDKLRSKHHTLIKPIRFGSEAKLDKEGKRFSLENIQNWVNAGQDVLEDEKSIAKANIIEDWIGQIAMRAKHFSDEKTKSVISDWSNILTKPESQTRKLFFETYTHHVNVVGATCSSIGKLSSTGKQTRFFNDYISVYHPTVSYRDSFQKRISFDLVIQDEASKASPPELALPCIYGKKAIVIGDHRQLPPMIDTNEFKENLEYLKYRSKDKKYKRKVANLIRTIDKNRTSFEESHFERLFKTIPENCKSTFNLQYRMHPAINETIKQFYIEEGGLECGLITPVDLGVNEPDLNNFASRFHGIEIEGLLTKDIHVLWFNVETPEFKKGTSRINLGEIEAVEYLINQITTSKGYQQFTSFWKEEEVEEKQIGVITFYGAQAGLLNKLKEKFPDVPLRISPVDRFQGMERNIVIVSTVRSNCISDFPNQKPDFEKYEEYGYPPQRSLGFAELPNRLNVALSRTKRLLIIVGNAPHFSKKHTYKKVLDTIRNHPNGRFLNYSDFKS